MGVERFDKIWTVRRKLQLTRGKVYAKGMVFGRCGGGDGGMQPLKCMRCGFHGKKTSKVIKVHRAAHKV